MTPHTTRLRTLVICLLQFITAGLFAQSPDLINYQGSVRRGDGTPLVNKSISIKFDLRQGGAAGTIVGTETQVMQTNALGLFSTEIGKNGALAGINWQGGALFLQVGVDTSAGTNYIDLGVQQLVSTPYAKHASTVPSSYINNILSVGGSTYALTPTMAVTPNTSITASGIGTVTSVGTNTFDITIQAPAFTSQGNATVTGAYPNYTVNSAMPSLVVTSTAAAGPSVTSTGSSFSLNIPAAAATSITSQGVLTQTGTGPGYTLSVPATSVSAAGIANVSNPATNSFVVSVPATSVSAAGIANVSNPATNSFVVSVPATSVSATGIANVSNPATNSFVVSVPATSVSAAGIANVSNPATNSFVVSVPAPTLSLNTNSLSVSAGNTVTLPSTSVVVTTTAAAGASVATSGYNSFSINIPPPSFTNTGQNIITGTYPNFSVNTPTVGTVPVSITPQPGAIASVSNPATNSFVIDVQPAAFTANGPVTITGSHPNYVLNSTAYTNGTGISITSGSVITNTAPDQVVSISNGGNVNVTGTYPNFVLSTPSYTNGTGIGITSGTIITNTAPDQVVSITNGGNVNVTGTYPNFVLSTPSYTNGTGIGITSGTIITNTAPDQVVSITDGGNVSVTGTYPNFVLSTPSHTAPNFIAGGVVSISTLAPYSYSISAPQLMLSVGGGSVSISGGNSVQLPVTAVTGAGIATVTGGPAYQVDVATPVFNNTGQQIITGSYPNFSVNTPTVPGTSIAVTSTAAAGPSVAVVGTNSFNINIPPTVAWSPVGNVGTSTVTNFIGTTDNVGLMFRVNNQRSGTIDPASNNVYFGYQSGLSSTSASLNAAYGHEALKSSTTSNRNTAFGYQALTNTNGSSNTGIGASALRSNTNGLENTALGKDALFSNTTGSSNTALGTGALLSHSTGDHNVAVGRDALNQNATGANNVALGDYAGYSNTGNSNVFIGASAGYNETGSNKFYLSNSSTSLTPLMYGDFSTNSIGIGTVTPFGNFHVQSNGPSVMTRVASTGAPLGLVQYADAASSALLNYQNTPLYFGTNGANRMVIDNTGNVGIGTSAPTTKLHVAGGTRLVDGNEGAGKVLTSDAAGNASWQSPAAGWGMSGNAGTNPAANYIGTSDAQDLRIKTNNVQRITITSGGNVAVGTTVNPVAPLVVQGNGANAGTIKLFNNNQSSNDQTFIGFAVHPTGSDATDIARIGSMRSLGGGEGRLYFMTGTAGSLAERMRIDENGNIGLGTSAPTATLHVVGTTRLVDGNQGAGKVLTSDAAGNATWQSGSDWGMLGNAGTNTLTNFIGTTDNVALYFRVNNQRSGTIDPIRQNVIFGNQSGVAITTGSMNSGVGQLALSANTSGNSNAAFGYRALNANLTGNGNAALGPDALLFNTTGGNNVAAGLNASRGNTTGNNNVALGKDALYNALVGSNNVAVGYQAGFNALGSGNVFLGNTAGQGETGSNKLYIANTAATPLIYGDFANGKVGINTTAPGAMLSVENNSATTRDGIHIANARDLVGAALPLRIDLVTNAQTYGTNTFGRMIRLNQGTTNQFYDMGIGSNNGFFIALGNNYSPAAVNISTLNYVGINTNTPADELHVVGSIRMVDGNQGPNKVMVSDVNGTATWQVNPGWGTSGTAGTSPATNFVGTTDNQDLVFRTNNTETFRALAGGGLRFPSGANHTISVQAPPTNAGGAALTIKAGDATGTGLAMLGGDLILQGGDQYNGTFGAYTAGNVYIRSGKNLINGSVPDGGSIIFHSVDVNNAYFESGRFDINGNFVITGTATKPGGGSWTASSDARLKTNVHAYKDGLAELMKIRPVWYTYNGEAGLPKETFVGVIAQELQQVSPYMVKEWTYRDPQVPANTTNYLSVDNSSMTYMIINAIKEQQKQIEDLKKTVEDQKAMIEQLQRK